MNTLFTVLGLLVFALMLALLFLLKGRFKLGFTARVLIALGLGFAFGAGLQWIFGGVSSGTGAEIKKWVDVVGKGFTRLLQFIIVPLVTVSIISAVAKSYGSAQGAKKTGLIIGFLLLTTMFSAAVSINVTKIFNLPYSELGTPSTDKTSADAAATLTELIPNNLFAALASDSVLPVVIIAALIGFAYLAIKGSNPELGKKFAAGLEGVREFVMQVVDFIIELTPYGILAIIASRAAAGSITLIVELIWFIIASFAAMAIVFGIHILILFLTGVSPVKFFRRAGAALLFAFSSRSSAATLPLTIKAQKDLGVSEANANLAGTLGTCIGQNACAGVYPTMVAILAGQIQGLNVWTPAFLIPLVIYVVIASIGTAGVGGGAVNVTLMVLSLMGLPLELAVLLVSVDFIIDMGRTAVNVSDSITAGYFVGWLEKDIDKNALNGGVSAEGAEK